MEWVETTAKTIEAAREAALDQLGVAADDAEFDILEEPKPGLFGRVRGEARVRARIRPTQARPKQERRRRAGKADSAKSGATSDAPTTDGDTGEATAAAPKSTRPKSAAPRPARKKAATVPTDGEAADSGEPESGAPDAGSGTETNTGKTDSTAAPARRGRQQGEQGQDMDDDTTMDAEVSPDEVGAAAVAFMDGLTDAFGMTAETELSIDGTVLEVNVRGTELGLLVGPGGRTLSAVQDLARVAAQRRLGDHETRLRIDVAGYRERREQALAVFARQVADQVRQSGVARSLEPMTSSDRKVVHDVLNEQDGVTSRSVGEDPGRRIIVEPA